MTFEEVPDAFLCQNQVPSLPAGMHRALADVFSTDDLERFAGRKQRAAERLPKTENLLPLGQPQE